MRLWVFGAPGSGKSTVCRKLAERYDVPFVELDEFFWAPNWQVTPTAVFVEKVRKVAESDAWIVDGNYTDVEPLLRARASGAIWLNLSFFTTYPRVLRRTFGRARSKQVLFGQNVETFRNQFSMDSMPMFALTNHRRNHKRFEGFWANFAGPKAQISAVKTVLPDAMRFCDSLR